MESIQLQCWLSSLFDSGICWEVSLIKCVVLQVLLLFFRWSWLLPGRAWVSDWTRGDTVCQDRIYAVLGGNGNTEEFKDTSDGSNKQATLLGCSCSEAIQLEVWGKWLALMLVPLPKCSWDNSHSSLWAQWPPFTSNFCTLPIVNFWLWNHTAVVWTQMPCYVWEPNTMDFTVLVISFLWKKGHCHNPHWQPLWNTTGRGYASWSMKLVDSWAVSEIMH